MQKLVEYADELVTKIGPRPGASKGEQEAAELIAANLENLGLDTWIQEFSSARGIGWVRILYYVLGVIAAELLFALPGLTPLALVLALVALVLLGLDLLGKNPLYNLLNRGLSQNVVARYVPDGADPRRKIVVVAHYDSGRSMLQCAPPIAPFYTIIRTVVRVTIVVLVAVALLALFPFPEVVLLFLSILGLIIGIVLLVAAVIEVINLFMPYNQGANCNASGVAAMMGVAETLAGVRNDAGVDYGSYAGAEPYERDYDEPQSRRPARGGTGVAASVGAAAGSLLSRARDITRSKDTDSEEERYEEYDMIAEQEPVQSNSQRLRSGEPVSRGLPPTQHRSSADMLEQEEIMRERRATAGTGDLGLTGSAGGAIPEADFLGQTPRGAQRNYAPNRATPRPSSGIPTENPAIRTRPPLAEQQERERVVQEEARASGENERTEDGTPSWFVNAKKAAHKDTAKATAAAADAKVSRSRYADVPVEYAPEANQRTTQKAAPKPEPRKDARAASEADAVAASDRAAASGAAAAADATQQVAEVSQAAPSAHETGAVRFEDTLRQREERTVQLAQPGDSTGLLQHEEDTKTRASDVPATTLNADFTGIDRLASDPLPTRPARTRVPESASALERAAAAPTPEIPANDRLRNLPKTSLNNSGAIQTQQATLDQQTMFEEERMVEGGTGKVSNTGSFAPLGATGIMKPVGEELFEYHEGDEQDMYLDDADEGVTGSRAARGEAADYSPNMVEIPQSRRKSFFGNLGDRLSGNKGKAESLDSSPSSWLGVDEDYDARTEGSQIGGWDNFSEEDDDGWKGGAYGGESYEEDAAALAQFSDTLIDKEVWIVALGSHENKNAGIKNLLQEYARELKSALIINVDGVGAGELFYTAAEGSFRPRGTDHRLQSLIKSAADAVGADFAPTLFKGYNTDASAAMAQGARAVSILGLEKDLPVGWRWSDDRLEILDEGNLEAVADVVVEVIKSV